MGNGYEIGYLLLSTRWCPRSCPESHPLFALLLLPLLRRLFHAQADAMYLQSPPSRPEPTPDPVPLAIRAAALGVFAAFLLGVLFFRLWAVPVLRTDQFVAPAQQNDVREITVPSPRGKILDGPAR